MQVDPQSMFFSFYSIYTHGPMCYVNFHIVGPPPAVHSIGPS